MSTGELDRDAIADYLSRATDQDPVHPVRSLDDVMADLTRLGLPAGGVVVLSMSNGIRLATLYFAALLTGLVPLVISPAAPSVRVLDLARRIGAHALVAGRLDPARYGATTAHPVAGAEAVLLGSGQDGAGRPGEVLMLTSGTSGSVSVCVHRVGSLLRNAARHARAVGLRAGDVVLVTLPLYYSYAMVAQLFAGLVSGASMVVSGPPFSPAAYLAALRDRAVSSSSVTPTIVRLLIEHGEPFPPSLRMLTVGGDWLSVAEVARLLAMNPAGELYLTYGLTEAGPRVSTLAAHAEPAHRHASVGVPLPGVQVHIRGGGQEGELLVESDTNRLRTIGATRAAPRPGLVATGDVMRIEDRYLYFRGRLSEFLVVRGEKVSLSAIRRAAHAIPGVVHATPHVERDGAEVNIDLRVVMTPGDPAAQRLFRRRLNASLLPSERPRSIAFVPPDSAILPK
jgi:acyl-CoA synthetase (AMP-forming)/AMP-acid ligase II